VLYLLSLKLYRHLTLNVQNCVARSWSAYPRKQTVQCRILSSARQLSSFSRAAISRLCHCSQFLVEITKHESITELPYVSPLSPNPKSSYRIFIESVKDILTRGLNTRAYVCAVPELRHWTLPLAKTSGGMNHDQTGYSVLYGPRTNTAVTALLGNVVSGG
jgi:hypothetical protein